MLSRTHSSHPWRCAVVLYKRIQLQAIHCNSNDKDSVFLMTRWSSFPAVKHNWTSIYINIHKQSKVGGCSCKYMSAFHLHRVVPLLYVVFGFLWGGIALISEFSILWVQTPFCLSHICSLTVFTFLLYTWLTTGFISLSLELTSSYLKGASWWDKIRYVYWPLQEFVLSTIQPWS